MQKFLTIFTFTLLSTLIFLTETRSRGSRSSGSTYRTSGGSSSSCHCDSWKESAFTDEDGSCTYCSSCSGDVCTCGSKQSCQTTGIIVGVVVSVVVLLCCCFSCWYFELECCQRMKRKLHEVGHSLSSSSSTSYEDVQNKDEDDEMVMQTEMNEHDDDDVQLGDMETVELQIDETDQYGQQPAEYVEGGQSQPSRAAVYPQLRTSAGGRAPLPSYAEHQQNKDDAQNRT